MVLERRAEHHRIKEEIAAEREKNKGKAHKAKVKERRLRR
jgi:hypothetical protein